MLILVVVNTASVIETSLLASCVWTTEYTNQWTLHTLLTAGSPSSWNSKNRSIRSSANRLNRTTIARISVYQQLQLNVLFTLWFDTCPEHHCWWWYQLLSKTTRFLLYVLLVVSVIASCQYVLYTELGLPYQLLAVICLLFWSAVTFTFH